jgi:hypothetical protein
MTISDISSYSYSVFVTYVHIFYMKYTMFLTIIMALLKTNFPMQFITTYIFYEKTMKMEWNDQ